MDSHTSGTHPDEPQVGVRPRSAIPGKVSCNSRTAMATKTALITGITGQDGSYLADFLLSKGYRVCGMVRRCSSENCQRIEHIRDDIELFQADLLDQTSLTQVLT